MHFICRGLCIVGLVLLYYAFSIGLTFYNKWLMKVRESSSSPQFFFFFWVNNQPSKRNFCLLSLSNLWRVSVFFSQDFHYPLFMTLVHIAMIFCLSALTRRILQCCTGKARIVLSWTDYLRKVAPTGEKVVVLPNRPFSFSSESRLVCCMLAHWLCYPKLSGTVSRLH